MRNEENSKHTISSHSTPFLICIHNSHISAKCSFTNSYSSLSKNRDLGRKLYLNVCHHIPHQIKQKHIFFYYEYGQGGIFIFVFIVDQIPKRNHEWTTKMCKNLSKIFVRNQFYFVCSEAACRVANFFPLIWLKELRALAWTQKSNHLFVKVI